jgi:osmotically-inducible protein OsmY
LKHQDWSANCETAVVVHEGRVVLKGLAPSCDHKASVRIIAENIPGVVSVNDQQTVMDTVLVQGF